MNIEQPNRVIGTTALGEKRMSVWVGKSINDPDLDVMFPYGQFPNGLDSRYATIPDIVDALLSNNPENCAWEVPYFTTLSAEYAGLSRTGIPLIVVAHGIGPMSSPLKVRVFYDGASNRMAYKERAFWKKTLAESPSCYDKDEDVIQWRAYNTERIKCLPQNPQFQKEFWKLCDGEYGEVSIVEMRSLMQIIRFSNDLEWAFDDAQNNPLMRAHLGSRAEELLSRIQHLAGEEDEDIILSCIASSYDSLERIADLQRGPVGYLLQFAINSNRITTGYWKPGFGVRFVIVKGEGKLTEIRFGHGDISPKATL